MYRLCIVLSCPLLCFITSLPTRNGEEIDSTHGHQWAKIDSVDSGNRFRVGIGRLQGIGSRPRHSSQVNALVVRYGEIAEQHMFNNMASINVLILFGAAAHDLTDVDVVQQIIT